MIEGGNLFAGIPGTLAAEQLTALLTTPNVRIERIVSRGHASRPISGTMLARIKTQ